MVRRNSDERKIEFYVGTDADGHKIPIPFDNTLIVGHCGSGKSTLVHTLMQDALLRYPSDRLEFCIWHRDVEYDLWDISKLPNERKRSIPNIRIQGGLCDSKEEYVKSLEYFFEDIADTVVRRYECIRESGYQNIWDYNYRKNVPAILPRVYVIDSWEDELSDDMIAYINQIMRLSRTVGVVLIWVAQNTERVKDSFSMYFLNKFCFWCTPTCSIKLLGSDIASNKNNKGVGRGEVIYQHPNAPYIPLDIPKFHYSLGKKIARALSQEML